MFHQKKIAQQKGTPILPGTTLLTDDKCKESINTIMRLLPFDTARASTCITGLLRSFARYCQQLPDANNSFYQLPSGLILRALDRTVAALELFNHYIVHDALKHIAEEQATWLYAVFSAALLQGIGKLVTDYRITIVNKNDEHYTWNPILGAFSVEARYYNYILETDNDETYQRNLHPLLAQAIMPIEGYTWIASNSEVFRVWLALLHEDWESAGTFGAILVNAEALGLQRGIRQYIESNPLKTSTSDTILPSTFMNIDNVQLASKNDLTIGALFIDWLQNAITTQEITWQQISRGKDVVITQVIFEQFAKKHTQVKNWHIAERGLLALKVHQENHPKQGIVLKQGVLAASLPTLQTPLHTFSGTFSRV